MQSEVTDSVGGVWRDSQHRWRACMGCVVYGYPRVLSCFLVWKETTSLVQYFGLFVPMPVLLVWLYVCLFACFSLSVVE